MNINQVSQAAVASNQPAEAKADAKPADIQHTQLGAGVAKGADASMFEEAAMTIASTRKIETKDDKSEKDILKKRLEESKKKVPDMPDAEKLNQTLVKMQQQMKSGNLNEETIKDLIGEYSGDATHQYVAVEDLIGYLQETGSDEDKELANKLQEYNTAFFEKNRTEIQAGLNISKDAAEFAANNQSAGDIQSLRDVWRDALNVPELNTALEAYQFAQAKSNGYENIEKGIEWMTLALARELDLTQTEASVDSIRMKHVRSQLERVFGTKTILDSCRTVENKLERLIDEERQN